MTELDARFSSKGASPTDWVEGRQHIEDAEVFWLSSVRPDGRPHVTPLLSVWHEDSMYFCTGPEERKAKNLKQNPHFTAGADVGDVFQNLTAAQAEARIAGFRDMAQRTERLPFPTLAAVRGLCLAAGLETILTLDLIWASENAQFAFAEPIIGLTPIIGGAYRLAARVGAGRAIETVLTARPYLAATMEQWGLVNRVLPDAELDEKSLSFAQRLAAGPTRAYEVTKRLLCAYRDKGVASADQLTPAACAALFETEDMVHGIESLLEHGPGHARFKGR